jgi:hypothetical protein
MRYADPKEGTADVVKRIIRESMKERFAQGPSTEPNDSKKRKKEDRF